MIEPGYYRFVVDPRERAWAIARCLADHRMTTGALPDVYCTCGWHSPSAGSGKRRKTHDTHVAQVIDLAIGRSS